MKKIVAVICLLACTAGADVVRLPGVVKEVISSDFSACSGKDVTQVVTCLCKLQDGSYRMYVVTQISSGRLFGMGRLAAPDFVDFKIESKRTAAVWE